MRYFKVLAIVFSLIIAGIIFGWLAVSLSLKSERVITPDLRGMNLVQAMSEAERYDLIIRLKDQRYSETVPRDNIIEQKPLPGMTIKQGRNIMVTVSKGPEDVIVPDLADLSWREVESHLGQAGLELGFISRVHSNRFATDRIISQVPSGGDKVITSNKVNILVSDGPYPRNLVTPDLIGKSINDIQNFLSLVHIRYEITERRIISDYPTGTVLEQNPPHGFPIQEGGVIRLVISRKSRLEDEGLSYMPLKYIVPEGTFPRVLRIVLVNQENEEVEVYKNEVLPGQSIYELIPQKPGSFLRIYLDGELISQEEVEPKE